MTDREQWLEERKKGITATDVAAICGVSKYRKPIDVYREKRGLTEPVPDSPAMMWGRRQEPVIADYYAETHGVELLEPGLMIHNGLGGVRGTPDRLVSGQEKGLEIKTAGSRMSRFWGDGGDSIPGEYLIQVSWYMAITAFPSWDVAVKIDSADYREYTVCRNERLESRLLEIAEEFWAKHVLAGEPPLPDGSAAYAKYVQEAFPEDSGVMIAETPEIRELALNLARAEAAAAVSGEFADGVRSRLKSVIGKASGIEGRGWKCTWKKAKDSAKTDYDLAFNILAERSGLPEQEIGEILDSCTAEKTGSRRFLFKAGDGLTSENELREAM